MYQTHCSFYSFIHLRSCVDIICIVAVIMISHSDYIASSAYFRFRVYVRYFPCVYTPRLRFRLFWEAGRDTEQRSNITLLITSRLDVAKRIQIHKTVDVPYTDPPHSSQTNLMYHVQMHKNCLSLLVPRNQYWHIYIYLETNQHQSQIFHFPLKYAVIF